MTLFTIFVLQTDYLFVSCLAVICIAQCLL